MASYIDQLEKQVLSAYQQDDKEAKELEPTYHCWSSQDNLWTDHAVWEHKTNALSYSKNEPPHNRYYSRGKDNTKVSYEKGCDERRLEHDQRNANRVLSFNNPYTEDFPSFANYTPFSIFGDQALTLHDFNDALSYYNQNEASAKAEELYGPFNQHNYNQIGLRGYNNRYWEQGWRNYHDKNQYTLSKHPRHDPDLPYLKKVAYEASKKFMNSFNRSFWHLQVQANLFHMGKTRLIAIDRSSQTGWLRYKIIVSLIRNTLRTAREFEFLAYFDPHTSKLILGQAIYMGITTSDKLLLPPGYDKNLSTNINNAGRPLHPIESKRSELIGKDKAEELYWKHMVKTRSFQPAYKFDNSLPFWFLSRQKKYQ